MTILEEAQAIIEGPRREAYGDAVQSFERLATVWSALLRVPVTARQVAHCMIALKLCRDSNAAGRDNLVDVAGYAALADQLK